MTIKHLFSWRTLEFFLLCIGFPSIIIFGGYGKMMIWFLWSGAAYCAIIYRINLHCKLRRIWSWSAVNWTNIKPMLERWIIACSAIYVFTYFYAPDKLFTIFDRDILFIPTLAIGYTLLSALPQEFIFCTFFFRRYARYFGRGRWVILASSTIFAYVHVLYANPIAPSVSFLGGLIFAHTYYKTKSLALVTLEHGLYGTSLFVIGLGHYFYSGAIGQG